MSVIYQRARPLHWDEVVGQEHVRGVLEGSLAKGKIGHAYLFSGPRGVGKTTTARLIAMTANCQSEGVPKPCGVCASCKQVIAGSHPDVFEIDAASNNSVDDVRELREKVGLSSMYGGKKVYILDEAHMMTKSAFNALLKTLEEPPEHVVFILATTEPERILPTILSRCQHYRFRRLSEREIAGKLERILKEEGTEFEPDALLLIGRLADGAMRDGESLLERMLAGGEAVTLHAVENALGLPPAQRMRTLATGLLERDPEPILRAAGDLYREGFAARSVVDGVKTALRQRLHDSLGLGEDKAARSSESASSGDLLRLLAALDEQDSRFVRSSDSLALEMALTHAMLALDSGKTADIRGQTSAGGTRVADPEMLSRLSRLEREIAELKRSGGGLERPSAEIPEFNPNRGGRPPTPSSATSRAPASMPPRAEPLEPQASSSAAPKGNWNDVLRMADAKTRAFLKPARAEVQGGHLTVFYDDKAKFHAKQISDKFDDLVALVGRAMGPLSLTLTTSEGPPKKKFLTQSESGGDRGGEPAKEPTGREVFPVARAQPESTPQELGVPEAQPSSLTPVQALRDPLPQSPPPRATSNARAFFEDASRAELSPLGVEIPPEAPPAPESTQEILSEFSPDPDLSEMPPLSSYDALNFDPINDVPLESAPSFEAPPVSSWDEVGESPARSSASRAPHTSQPRSSGSGATSSVSVQQHPLYDEVQKLFPRSQVRAKGKVKPKGVPRAEEDPEDESVKSEM